MSGSGVTSRFERAARRAAASWSRITVKRTPGGRRAEAPYPAAPPGPEPVSGRTEGDCDARPAPTPQFRNAHAPEFRRGGRRGRPRTLGGAHVPEARHLVSRPPTGGRRPLVRRPHRGWRGQRGGRFELLLPAQAPQRGEQAGLRHHRARLRRSGRRQLRHHRVRGRSGRHRSRGAGGHDRVLRGRHREHGRAGRQSLRRPGREPDRHQPATRPARSPTPDSRCRAGQSFSQAKDIGATVEDLQPTIDGVRIEFGGRRSASSSRRPPSCSASPSPSSS